MKKQKEKTNSEYIREIISEFSMYNKNKADEAIEFLDALEKELSGASEIEELENQIEHLEQEKEKLEEIIQEQEDEDNRFSVSESVSLGGLDVFHWGLDQGNLKITEQIESFVEKLKIQYVGPTSPRQLKLMQ